MFPSASVTMDPSETVVGEGSGSRIQDVVAGRHPGLIYLERVGPHDRQSPVGAQQPPARVLPGEQLALHGEDQRVPDGRLRDHGTFRGNSAMIVGKKAPSGSKK